MATNWPTVRLDQQLAGIAGVARPKKDNGVGRNGEGQKLVWKNPKDK